MTSVFLRTEALDGLHLVVSAHAFTGISSTKVAPMKTVHMLLNFLKVIFSAAYKTITTCMNGHQRESRLLLVIWVD